MKYFIHIDESGKFDEGLRRAGGTASVTGGACSRFSHGVWETVFMQLVARFNQEEQVEFCYPSHFHCAKLVKGELPGTENIPKPLRVRFAEEVFNVAIENANFGLISINDEARFEFSRQATYGVNVVAVLKASLTHIARHLPDCDALEIMIAQRTIGETAIADDDPTPYMDDLLLFLNAQLLSGHDEGVKLARKLTDTRRLVLKAGKGTSDAGLMAADFLCRARVKPDLLPAFAVRTTPSDIVFGDYEAYYQLEVHRLIDSQQYAAAISIARRSLSASEAQNETRDALDRLKEERDAEILGRELPALLAEAHLLIEKRTSEPRALPTAQHILKSLIKIASALLLGAAEPAIKRRWADMLINGLVELSTCHNHAGESGPQAEIEQSLEQALGGYGGLVSSTYHQKSEILLEAKTRNLNLLFNDYRFAKVIDTFEGDVVKRRAEIPAGATDELLGKMLGSLGQAYAFMARTEPDWAATAREYLEQSKSHFSPGTLFHAMAVNYVTTLAVQDRDPGLASREMSGHANLPQIRSPAAVATGLCRFAANEKASAFDAVNYLRIASLCAESGMPIDPRSLQRTFDHWMPRVLDAHPHEQLCKWLAYLYYLAGDFERASNLCEKGLRISLPQGFTIQSIGLSLLGLHAICRFALKDALGFSIQRNAFEALAQKLAGQSVAFTAYLQSFGGAAGLVAIVDEKHPDGAAEICRFPPFAYM